MDKIQVWAKVNNKDLRFDWSGGHGINVYMYTDQGNLTEIHYFNVGSFKRFKAMPGPDKVLKGIQNKIEEFEKNPDDFRQLIR